MLQGSRESSVGQLICISKPDRCVETISSPWLESVATVGNYLLFLSSVGLGIKLSIKGGLWEPECSSVRAASEWRPHTPHRHFCPRDLGHQQVCLCFDKKQACSPLEDSAKTISGIMPIPYFLLQTVASELVCCDAESLQAPTGLTGCCLQALILWVWMSGKSSIKLVAYETNLFYLLLYQVVFQMKIWVPDCPVSDIFFKDWLRTFFLCFQFFFLGRPVAMGKINHYFQVPGTHM